MPLQSLTFQNYDELTGVINGLALRAQEILDNPLVPVDFWPLTLHIEAGKVGQNQALKGHAHSIAAAAVGAPPVVEAETVDDVNPAFASEDLE